MINIKNFNAVGDGIADDSSAIQEALNQGDSAVHIPSGKYKISSTLFVHSNTTIRADEDAVLFCADHSCKGPDDHLLANSDRVNGNENITIIGGIWDGNNRNNSRVQDPLDTSSFTGTMLSFYNIRNLKLSNMVLKDPEAYYTRFCQVSDFTIEDIEFRAETIRPNQDGLHFAGFCENGTIKRVFAHTAGIPGDDMLAFNADDEMYRLTNVNLQRGYIRNIDVSDVHAVDCHSLIRLLSIDAEISNITIRNISSGCRQYAVNMDAARYCLTPLFEEKDHRYGVGNIKNIYIEDITAWKTLKHDVPLMDFETNVEQFVLKNFKRDRDKEAQGNTAPTMRFKNLSRHSIELDDENREVSLGEELLDDKSQYHRISVDRIDVT